MSKPIHQRSIVCVAIVMLSLTSGIATAQTADQSFQAIPQQVKASAETKATTKTTTVSDNAMNKLDSASNKAFNGLTGLFKKKHHPKNQNPKADSAGVHPADTAAVPPKTSFRPRIRPSLHLVSPMQEESCSGYTAFTSRYNRRLNSHTVPGIVPSNPV